MTYLNSLSTSMLTGLLAAMVVFVIAVIWLARYLYKTAESRKVTRIVKKYSKAYEREIVFADGIGGYFFIDYLILLPSRILAFNAHSVEGFVFGGENIELWTQVEKNKSIKFKNPVANVTLFVNHIADQLAFDRIIGRVLFDGSSNFPKGVPEGVLQLASLKQSMATWAKEAPVAEATHTAWDKLSALIAENRAKYNKETGGS